MLLQGVVNLKNSPQEGAKQAYLYVFLYHLSTIEDFIDMMYNYAMEIKYFTEEQFNDMSHDTLVSLVMNMQNNMIEMQRSVDQLTEQIRLMNQRHFGRKTEKSSSLYEQLALFVNETEAIHDEEEIEEEPELKTVVRKRPKGKKESDLAKITNHRDEYIRIPEEELNRRFGVNGWKELPSQLVYKLEHIPASFEAITYHIGVYADKNTDEIIRADKPAELWTGSVATPSLVSSIITAKYSNSVPLYRQEQTLKANDVFISRKVMADWVIRVYERYLKYMYEGMRRRLLNHSLIHADETPFHVTKDGSPAGSKSYMWVYLSDTSDAHPIVIYDYCPTRGTENVARFLADYSGYIVCDGYESYHKLERDNPERFTVAGCWAHVKRKFTEICKANAGSKKYLLAAKAEKKIQKIYQEDNKLINLNPEERTVERQKKVKPLVDEFFAWIEKNIKSVAAESATGAAMSYALHQEKYLRVFLSDGQVPLDNNAAERKIRNFCIGKKNWMMVDTRSGAYATACMYSIVETVKANNLKTYEYLTYVLEEMSKCMQDLNTEVPERLMPWSDELPEYVHQKDTKQKVSS